VETDHSAHSSDTGSMSKKNKKKVKPSKPRQVRKAAAPAKLGEKLLPGKPVVATAEIVANRVAADEQLGDDQVLQILAECVPKAGGSSDEIQMTKALKDYGFLAKDQVLVLNTFVTGNKDFGVQRYGFKLSDDGVAFAAPATLMNDYATAIQSKAKK
jgi:hypothetical protein